MIVVTRTDLEREIWKDLAIVALALLLTALLASIARGAEQGLAEPNPMPPEMILDARPLPAAAAADDARMREILPAAPTVDPAPFLMGMDTPQRVWQVMEMQRAFRWEEAIAGWKQLVMAPDHEAWRQIAIAHAHLARHDLEAAQEALDLADRYDNGNALVYYLSGMLYMRQAERAYEWPDMYAPPRYRLVSTAMPGVAPNTRSMYQLAAAAAFERAIDFAATVPYDLPLAATTSDSMPLLVPTVRDLLVAMKADRFEAHSHRMLGKLWLERYNPELSEMHLDAARNAGLIVATAYRDLAAFYAAEGRHVEAFRVNLKAMTQRRNLLQSLNDAVREWNRAYFED